MQADILESSLNLLLKAFPGMEAWVPRVLLQIIVIIALGIPFLPVIRKILNHYHNYLLIRRSRSEMGLINVWADRYEGFPQGTQQYRAYCEKLIDGAPPSSTIRLMTTVGSGAAIFVDFLKTPFQNALKRGCSFQIILQNPLSPEIPMRIRAIRQYAPRKYEHKYDDLPDQIAERLGYIFNWINQVKRDPEIKNPHITVRCTDSSPTINLIDNGKLALIAFATINHVGGEFPMFLAEKGKKLYTYCGSYFEYVYAHSIPAKQAVEQYLRSKRVKVSNLAEKGKT